MIMWSLHRLFIFVGTLLVGFSLGILCDRHTKQQHLLYVFAVGIIFIFLAFLLYQWLLRKKLARPEDGITEAMSSNPWLDEDPNGETNVFFVNHHTPFIKDLLHNKSLLGESPFIPSIFPPPKTPTNNNRMRKKRWR